MPSLSVRFVMPLAAMVLLGAPVIARANVTQNLCKLYCDKKVAGELLDSQIGNCFGLAFYVANDLKCGAPDAQKKEPCVTILKLFAFICPGPDSRVRAAPVCTARWMGQCYKAGGLSDPSSIVPLSGAPKTPWSKQGDRKCAPNMVAGANGNCVPNLDNMPGIDSTPGSMPGAGRTMPSVGGGAAPARRP